MAIAYNVNSIPAFSLTFGTILGSDTCQLNVLGSDHHSYLVPTDQPQLLMQRPLLGGAPLLLPGYS